MDAASGSAACGSVADAEIDELESVPPSGKTGGASLSTPDAEVEEPSRRTEDEADVEAAEEVLSQGSQLSQVSLSLASRIALALVRASFAMASRDAAKDAGEKGRVTDTGNASEE